MFKKTGCRFEYFNIAFFAAVMWFWGLALATHKLEKIYELTTHFSYYILIFTLIFFILVSLSYIVKIIINFSDVKADFNHPVKSNFFPWIWKIFLIFSIWFLTINSELSNIFWILWVSIQSIFTVIIFRRWMLHEQDIKAMNPLWFLPIVWNMLVPVAWVQLGFIELSWFFFSVWLIMWAVMFTVIMNRIIFHNPLAQKLMPTLFILIAPPSVWFISSTVLNGWEITDLWKILYYFSLFMFVIIISKINVLGQLKFFMSWWAYSFPMAVLTTSTILFYEITWFSFIWYLWILFFIILILIILWLFYRTFLWMKRKELCVEE
jgi:tellurite resistance protein